MLVGALLIGVAFGLACFAIGFVWFYVRLVYTFYLRRRKRRAAMTTYTFKLYRRVRNHKHPMSVIISAFNLQVECYDPFVERIRLAHQYPGWAIANEFSSATDETFKDIFGEDEAAA